MGGSTPPERAERVCALVHEALRYEPGATTVETSTLTTSRRVGVLSAA